MRLRLVIAQSPHRAGRAVWLAGVAYLATEADQVQVRRIVSIRQEQALEVLVRLFDSHLLRPQSDAPADPVNVCVDGERRLVQREL